MLAVWHGQVSSRCAADFECTRVMNQYLRISPLFRGTGLTKSAHPIPSTMAITDSEDSLNHSLLHVSCLVNREGHFGSAIDQVIRICSCFHFMMIEFIVSVMSGNRVEEKS